MPHAALHFLLAERVLERWEADPLRAPVEPSPAVRNAFLHGALGPDMGFFPGADPLVSRLAHHARAGALCRALVAEARAEVELAFAWGWVTHVLADVAIHPLVNQACGELLAGDRDRPLWGPEVAAAHAAVEIGLDAAFRRRLRVDVRLRPALDAAGVRGVLRAFRATYGAAPAARAVADAHRRVCLAAAPLALLRRAATRALDRRPGALRRVARAAAAAPLGVLSACLPAGSGARGLFTPVAPPVWLAAEVEEIVEGFADWFEGHHASRLAFLRDHCLDTGEVGAGDSSLAREVMAELHARFPARGTPRLRAAA